MSAVKNIVLDTPVEELEHILSPYIEEQFPGFVRADYTKLILFVKAYYEWLEKKGNPGYVLSNLDETVDVDANLQEFYSHFKSTYLETFPEVLATDLSGNKPNKNTLIKKIRDFYGNKGTESAYRFLFRVLYDSDVEFYLPSTDVLKVSDGKWVEPVSIKTTSNNGASLFSAKGNTVYQYNETTVVASGFVESVIQYNKNGTFVTEMFLSSITGTFSPDSEIIIPVGTNKLSEKVFSVLGDIYIEDAGRGYRVGDTITLYDNSGSGFSAKIAQTGLAGGIKKISIIDSGINYSASSFLLTVFSESGSVDARVYANRTALTKYPGYFKDNSGKPSSNKRIQNSDYYQSFSYELKSSVSIDVYYSTLKKMIHPSGMKMFGSILVKQAIVNDDIAANAMGIYYQTPVVGKYTPYRLVTQTNLRNNGVNTVGLWLGATGDLYPIGYNPYIGSTTEVGPNGKTTSLGTIFVGTSMGYTWCYVPEDGITAHNPIGAPLGSTASWYAKKDSNYEGVVASMRGLELWLKPENIGVCGAVANGATVDVWRDASPKQNHAVPPTWDRINHPVEYFKQTTALDAATGWSSTEGFGAGPYTNYTATHGHTAPDGSLTATRIIRLAGSSADGLMYAKYMSFVTGRKYRYSIMMRLGESFPTDTINLGNVYGPRVYNGTSPAYGSPYSTALVSKNYWTKIEVEFTATNSANATLRAFDHGHVDIYGTGTGINNYVDMYVWAPTVEDITNVGYGVTFDKLRPRLFAASIAGPTGVCFNGGVLYSPSSKWNGLSLSSVVSLGTTYGESTVPGQILTAQHLYLKNGLTLPAEADIFMVFRSTSDDWKRGVGVVGSKGNIVNMTRSDSVIHHRSYNLVDRDSAKQTGEYYLVTPTGRFFYPSSLPAGLVGFRPGGESVDKTVVSYDPHVSGVCLGTVVGEWSRDETGVVETYLNGDKSLNKSRNTGIFMSAGSYPTIDEFAVDSGLEFYFDAGKTACVGKYVEGSEKNLLRSVLFTPTMRSVLKPLDIGAFGRDSTTALTPVTRVTSVTDSTAPAARPSGFAGAEVFRMRTGTSGNLYVNPVGNWIDSNYVGFVNSVWTGVFYIRRTDGQPITSASMYMYFDSADGNAAAATVQLVGNGWYRVSRTRRTSVNTEHRVILFGLTGLGAGVEYDVSAVQLLPYGTDSQTADYGEPFGITLGDLAPKNGIRTIYGNVIQSRIERHPNPWGDYEAVWRAVNHSINSQTSGWNGGFLTDFVTVDPTKLYRFSVWVRKINSYVAGENAEIYLGLETNRVGGGALSRRTASVPSDQQNNPYFTVANSATGLGSDWVLIVAHVHPAETGVGDDHPMSGYYRRSVGGTTFASLRIPSVPNNYSDRVWDSTTTRASLRTGLYGGNLPGSEAQFLRPRIDVVDGTEPTVQELLNNGPNTIYDLSGNQKNMYALTPPVYEYENGGSLVFNKIRGTGVRTISGTAIPAGAIVNSTWEGWVLPIVAPFYQQGMWMNGNPFPYFIVGPNGSQYNSFATTNTQRVIAANPPTNVVQPTITKFIHLVTTFQYLESGDTTTIKVYANGQLVNEGTQPGKNQIFDVGVPVLLGQYGFPGLFTAGYAGYANGAGYWNYLYTGKIAIARVYSRTLSQQEIVQNYNSSRVRFGV